MAVEKKRIGGKPEEGGDIYTKNLNPLHNPQAYVEVLHLQVSLDLRAFYMGDHQWNEGS